MEFDLKGHSLLLLIIFVSFLYLLKKLVQIQREGTNKLPPGPLGIPILGNFFQLARSGAWLDFERWKEQYGPLVYISVAGQGMLIISDHAVAVDLLDRRSSVYSDRPRAIVSGEIFTGGLFMVFAKQSDMWVWNRSVIHCGDFPTSFTSKTHNLAGEGTDVPATVHCTRQPPKVIITCTCGKRSHLLKACCEIRRIGRTRSESQPCRPFYPSFMEDRQSNLMTMT